MERRLKVLVSAYACEPDKGSEPGVGWNWVKQIARFHEVWVITRENNRQPIEQALLKEPMDNVHWFYFDLPHWARFWKKGQRGMRLYYYLWQIGVYQIGKRLHEEVDFDIVHHVTFGKYGTPSFLILLPVPFIWGPVGGGESFPKTFYKDFSLRSKVYEYFRDVARWFGEHDPFVRYTARHAQLSLATTPQTEERLKQLRCKHVEVLYQLTMSDEEVVILGSLPLRRTSPFRLVSIGRLLHWKGFHFGLKAFAQFQLLFPESEYYVIGDGPERRNLERMIRECGLVNKVRFWGELPRQQVLAKLAECDVLVHPSLHDSGGWACLEAMAAGRPVICLDLGGPASSVTEESGIKMPAVFPEQVVDDIAQAMLRLARDPGLRVRMGQAARNRVAAYFSDEQGRRIKEIYEEVLDRKCLQ